LWDKVFPSIILKKNIEEINSQLNELLRITTKLQDDSLSDKRVINEVNSNDDFMDLNITDQEILQEKVDTEEKQIIRGPDELALDIIKLRDQLIIAKEYADENTKKNLNNIYKEIGRILDNHGIESIDEVGDFNCQYQTIVETRDTDNIDLKDRIAESYKPGYRMNGKIIRAQEIIIYSYSSKENL
jgi:molecular chaperone GrpE (heat shock protein)